MGPCVSFPDEPTLNKGFLHAPSVLSKLHPPLVVHDALRSVGANRVILGVFFCFIVQPVEQHFQMAMG